MHSVSGQEAQRNCMIEQYENDMAEIERLQGLLAQCKTVGCSQNDLDGTGIGSISIDLDANGGTPSIQDIVNALVPKKWHTGGKIRFPDCGTVIEGGCFWQHYQTYWFFDFLAVLMAPQAIVGCAFFDTYEYNFCLGNLPYVAVDSFTRTIAPYISDETLFA